MKVSLLFGEALTILGACFVANGCGGGASSTPAPQPSPAGISVSISPKSVENFPAGGTQSFKATVIGSVNQSVTWSVQEGTAGGVITAEGVYTASQTPGTFHIIANSVADRTKSDTAKVTVPPVSVAISPKIVSLGKGETQTFQATVIGSLNAMVNWGIQEGGQVAASPARVFTQHLLQLAPSMWSLLAKPTPRRRIRQPSG